MAWVWMPVVSIAIIGGSLEAFSSGRQAEKFDHAQQVGSAKVRGAEIWQD
jgi:hypothetical protein